MDTLWHFIVFGIGLFFSRFKCPSDGVTWQLHVEVLGDWEIYTKVFWHSFVWFTSIWRASVRSVILCFVFLLKVRLWLCSLALTLQIHLVAQKGISPWVGLEASSFFPIRTAAVWVIAIMATWTGFSLDFPKAVATAVTEGAGTVSGRFFASTCRIWYCVPY